MDLTIRTEGVQQTIQAIETWEADLGNLRGPLVGLAREVIAPLLLARFKAGGPGWAPLSPAYAAWKAKHYPGRGILERSLAMETAFAGGVGWEIVVTADTLRIDPSRVPYWRAHQAGTKHLPARPIQVYDAVAQEQMRVYLEQYGQARARAAGLTVREVA